MSLKLAITFVSVIIVMLMGFAFLPSTAATYTVTLQASPSSVQAVQGTTITISGTVSPAPGVSGAITVQITGPSAVFTYSPSVDGSTGAFSQTVVSGPSTGANPWTNGTYSVEAIWSAGPTSPVYTATTSFVYGSTGTTTTTTTSTTSTPSVVTSTVTSTVTQTQTTTSIQTQTQTTTSIQTQTQTTTSIQTQTQTTTQTETTTTATESILWVGMGIGGIVAAVILGALAAFMARRR